MFPADIQTGFRFVNPGPSVFLESRPDRFLDAGSLGSFLSDQLRRFRKSRTQGGPRQPPFNHVAVILPHFDQHGFNAIEARQVESNGFRGGPCFLFYPAAVK